MSGDRYPRSLIEPLLVKAALPESYRIMPRRYLGSPLGTTVADSRFASGGAGYTLLYAAPEFATAFIETVVRDRLVGRRGRELVLRELTERISVRVSGRAGQVMALLDLRGDGCTRIRAPTDVGGAGEESRVGAGVPEGDPGRACGCRWADVRVPFDGEGCICRFRPRDWETRDDGFGRSQGPSGATGDPDPPCDPSCSVTAARRHGGDGRSLAERVERRRELLDDDRG